MILTGEPNILGVSNWHDLFQEYPELEDVDLQQALEFAAASLDDKLVELRTV